MIKQLFYLIYFIAAIVSFLIVTYYMSIADFNNEDFTLADLVANIFIGIIYGAIWPIILVSLSIRKAMEFGERVVLHKAKIK